MNRRAIRAIIVKDLRQVLSNRAIWLPMIIVPGLINVFMPVMVTFVPLMAGGGSEMDDLGQFLAMVPVRTEPGLLEMTAAQQWVLLSTSYIFAPMYLIVPLMMSSIIGSDSFVGEKERRTLEGLFYTPLRDRDIFIAKVLTGLIPSQLISLFSFLLYTVVVNAVGYPIMRGIFFPRANWVPLVFWVGPAISVLGMGATVLVSSKAKTFMQAQQMAGALVLPVVFLMISQMAGLVFLGPELLWLLGGLIWIAGLWLTWIGARTFRRGRLLASI